MKTVKMKVYFPGMMSGEVLPRQGESVTLSDIDADLLVARGLAEFGKPNLATPVENASVVTAETAAEKRGPGRPPKNKNQE